MMTCNSQCTRKAYSGALRRCPCGLSNYCSRACQQADWEARHRSACGLRTCVYIYILIL
ncbi:hypothetical protein BD626DRAFT_477652, partial [Schizophyllum amplum]